MADAAGTALTAADRVVAGLSLSHAEQNASADRIAAAAGSSQREAVAELLEPAGVAEAFVLWTCNRAEWYVVAETTERARDALAVAPAVAHEYGRPLDHEASLEHLLRVAAGLESVVLGEDQILGQVQGAYEDARAAGGIGPTFETVVEKALRTGRRARTETAINDGVVSLPSAAVRLVRENAGLAGGTAVVVGAGEMGRLAAEHMAPHADRLVVANRTPEHAAAVTDDLGDTTRPAGLDELPTLVADAHVVVSATGSPEPVFERETLAAAGETFVVDLAQPRDTPPSVDELSGLTVYDLDRLEVITDKTRRARREAAEQVTEMVAREHDRLTASLRRTRAEEAIATMYDRAADIKAEAVETALDELELAPEEEAVVESMADTLVSQLLATPTANLRAAAEHGNWAQLRAAAAVLDLDTDTLAAAEDPSLTADAQTTDRTRHSDRVTERLDD